MATTETQRASADGADPFFEVVIEFAVTNEITREQLEDVTVEVLEVVEKYATHLVSDAVASAKFEPPTVVLDLDVQAVDPGEMHQRLGELLHIISQHTGLKIGASATRAQPAERELVCA